MNKDIPTMRSTIKCLMLLCLLVIGRSVLAQTGGTVTYVYTDPQGTPLAEADAAGNITATFDYAPYGSTALGTPPNGPGYTGHVNDPETDLVYMQARYYDPATGRFLSVDPAAPTPGDAFKLNRYAYADNNPIARMDPDGRDPDYAFGVGVGLSPWISNKDKAFLQRVLAQANMGSASAGVDLGQSIKEVVDTEDVTSDVVTAVAAKMAMAIVTHGKSGFYTIKFKSGMKYHGKGSPERMARSASDKSSANEDPVESMEHTPADSTRDAFKGEAKAIADDGGPGQGNYNKINSPGKKFISQDEKDETTPPPSI